METIDQALPFDPSGFGEEDLAFRFFYATSGYLGWIVDIIRHAARGAIKQQCAQLSLPLLAAAYDARIAGTTMGIGKENPFTDGFTEASVKKIVPAPSGSGSAKRGERATTKRGRKTPSTQENERSDPAKQGS